MKLIQGERIFSIINYREVITSGKYQNLKGNEHVKFVKRIMKFVTKHNDGLTTNATCPARLVDSGEVRVLVLRPE